MSKKTLETCDLEQLEEAVGGVAQAQASQPWLAQAQSAIFGEPKTYRPPEAAKSPEPEPNPALGMLGSMGGGGMGSMLGGGQS